MNILSGNKFASIPGIFYQSIDDLFHKKPRPNEPYVMVTHGGDPSINEQYAYVLEDENLIHWYATNAGIQHEKLTCIPIGVAYGLPEWQERMIHEVMNLHIERTGSIYANFKVHDHVESRHQCKAAMDRLGIPMQPNKPYLQYLKDLKSYKYCLCPIGNGIDTFRLWEALYMGCIPILSRTMNKENIVIEQYKQKLYKMLPDVYFFDSWKDLSVPNYDYFWTKVTDVLDFNYWQKIIQTSLMELV